MRFVKKTRKKSSWAAMQHPAQGRDRDKRVWLIYVSEIILIQQSSGAENRSHLINRSTKRREIEKRRFQVLTRDILIGG